MISAMNLSSKVRSFLKKIRRSSKLKYYYYRYHRLVDHYQPDDDDHGVAAIDDRAPRIYVSVYVGKEGTKSYDVPLMYLSLPWFQQMMIRSSSERSDLETTDLDRPIIVDCTPEMFELFLELWSFKWDFDEGNFFNFMKKFETWSRLRHEYLSTVHGAASRRRSDETSLCSSSSSSSSCDSTA